MERQQKRGRKGKLPDFVGMELVPTGEDSVPQIFLPLNLDLLSLRQASPWPVVSMETSNFWPPPH